MAWDPSVHRAASQRVSSCLRAAQFATRLTRLPQVVPDASRAWNVSLRGGQAADTAKGRTAPSVGGRLHKLGGAGFRMKQQQQQQQQQQPGQLRTPPSKIIISSPSLSSHKQRRVLERSAETPHAKFESGDGQANGGASAEKRPRVFEGGGGFLPPQKAKQQQQRRPEQQQPPPPPTLGSGDLAPPSNPFFTQQQQPSSAGHQQAGPKQQLHQPHKRQQPSQQRQQQKQQHHPRMALEMSISKNANRGGGAVGGRRVVMMSTPSLPASSVAPKPASAAVAPGRGRGGGASVRGVGRGKI